MTDYRIKGEVKAPAKYMDSAETLKDLYPERIEFTAILTEHDPRSTDNLGPLLDPYYENRPVLTKTARRSYVMEHTVKGFRVFSGLRNMFDFNEFTRFMEGRFAIEKIQSVSSIGHTLPAQDRITRLHIRPYDYV